MPKFACPSSGAAPISPSRHSSWGRQCSQFGRNKAVLFANRISSSTSSKGDTSAVSGIQSTAGYQWVYGPINGGAAITGTCSWSMRGHDATFVNIYTAKTVAWIAKPDGSSRGTLFTDIDSINWTTTFATYSGSASCSSVTPVGGDYLVMEIGWDDSTFTDFEAGTVEIGDTRTDLFFDFSDTDLKFWLPAGLTYSNDNQRVKRGQPITTMADSSTGGPIASYAVQTGSLPPGVTLDTSTGDISGTPTQNGTYTWTIRATNEGGTTDSGTLTMTVYAGNSIRVDRLAQVEVRIGG